MIKIIDCKGEYKRYKEFVLLTFNKYVKKMKLEYIDFDIKIIDDENMARVNVNLRRNVANVTVEISKHFNDELLDKNELENSIVHELVHVMMVYMDTLTDNVLSEDEYEAYDIYEDSFVDKIAGIIVG